MRVTVGAITGKARKQAQSLPSEIQRRLRTLTEELRREGPLCPAWPNFGNIMGAKNCFHCHLKKGHPTYVAVWKVIDDKIKIIEVRYAGSHEGANYSRIC
jgi:hypothetical protein